MKLDRIGKDMSDLVFDGMDELNHKDLRRLARFMLDLLEEKERSQQRKKRKKKHKKK